MATTADVRSLPAPDPEAVIDFLAYTVSQAIHLCSIDPETGVTIGRWFGEDAQAATDWIVAENRQRRNAHWTPNVTRPGVNKKSTKADTEAARFLHLDVDPPKDGRPFERQKLLNRLETMRAPPSFIVNSGNGLQAFWRLDGFAQNLPAVEALNKRLQVLFEADACWSIDHLMRVPGTVNWPNAKKRAAGRVQVLADIAVQDENRTVEPEEMHAILPVLPVEQQEPRERVKLDGVEAVALASLRLDLGDRLIPLLTSREPGDRSGRVLRVAGMMVRRGYDDDTIAGVLLNPDLAVSDHCYDQPNPQRAVERAIGRARADHAADPGKVRPGESETARHSTVSDQPGTNASKGGAAQPMTISATPFRWPDPSTLPRRPWVFGRWLLRATVSAIVAPGGVGKSSFVASMLLSLASGRQVIGKTVWGGPKRVWYWNLEDNIAELEMQLVAASMYHHVGQAECSNRVFLDSGPEGQGLCIARQDQRDGHHLCVPVVEALTAELLERRIDVLVVDPFVSSHAVAENDNVAIDAVAKAWARVAKNANCSIVLVHHSKKLAGEKVTAESSRGASALVSAARVTLVLNRMDPTEGKKLGIVEERERRRLFTVQDDKANRAPAEDATWFRIASQDVGNSTGPDDPWGEQGDSVGVVVPWTPPDMFEGVTAADLRAVQERVHSGQYRASSQARDWVGKVVAEVLGLSADPSAKEDRAKINAILRTWFASGALIETTVRDEKSNVRPAVAVGEWAIVDGVPTSRNRVRKGGEGVEHFRPHPTSPPLWGGGGEGRRGQGRQGVERQPRAWA